MSPWQKPDNMSLWKRTALAFFGLFLCLTLGDFLIRTDKHEVDNNGPRFTSRRLMAAEETTDDSSDLAPIPVVDFWISGDTVPHLIDGGSVLMYNWHLTHTVKPEHTAINVTFKVDFPYLAFDESSVNISLSSYSFEMNETRINPMFVNWIQDQSTVQIKVDISEPLWINLTEPWRLPDCWWTPGQNCYKTSYEDCVFFDTSEEQNWDPAFCYHFNISRCLPHNTTSECFFVQPYECLSRLMATFPDEPHELLCPVQPNTTCIQVNDRGLFFTQYDWTVPTKAPILATFNKEFCNMSTEEIWTYEEDRNGTVYTVDIFISEDIDRACRTVLMKLKPVPATPEPTYNPYKELPTTLDYVHAKDCINVNTTSFYYPPPEPINWQDFNLTVVIVGELPNFIDVNQIFSPVLATTIIQQTRPVEEQITSLNASLDYTVRRPSLHLQPTASFSEVNFALKHEQFFYRLIIRHPEAINHGIEVTISFPAIEGIIPMAFLNVTPWWSIGANLVATTSGSMFNETHDGAGHFVTMDTTQEVMTEKRFPGIVAHFASSEEGSGIIDELVFQIEPFINVMDQRNSGADMIMMWFYSRVLTEVLPGQQLELKAKAVYKFTRNAFSSGSSPKVMITDQPFVPLIPASDRTLSPDSADLVLFTFDLSHTLDFDVNDIWMNVSCPDLQIIPGTLEMDFLEPDMNMTTNSSSDLSFTTETTYHIHLVMLAPGVNLLGNQTFLMWNNSMLTHQEIICNVMLSYRKGTEALILPYLAGHSPAVTLQGIQYVLYPKDLVGQNDTMYYMPVGSNATFILNVTFSETTTKLDIRLKMPAQVLAVYYAHVIYQGTRLTLEDQGTIAVETTNNHVDDWDIPARTVVDLDFGMVENLADNKLDSAGDNLILEFNAVLENTTDLVSRDKEHTLTTTVSYSNGKDLVQEATVHVWEPEMILMYNLTNETLAGDPDLVQEATVHVWEPEMILMYNLTNETLAGDPGDVFQYSLYLTHTEPSQTPAHHILIEIYLPYMAVYQDFVPGNLSDHVPKTQIIDELGIYEADGKLQLYVFKMAVGEILEGTFLIQISTKLTEGMALLATSQYHIYSFYQWGRVYHYTAVSDNVINIRNATLVFDGTSHPQTPDNTVTINEQVMYSMVIPVPPIPSNLSVTIHLPQFEVSLKTWEVLKLREEQPRRPFPIEGTFVRQGCFPNQTVITDACFCATNPLSGNGTFYRVYPDWLETCREIPKENCTGVDVDGGIRSTRNQTVCNGTSMNCTQCGYNNTSNCSVTNDTYAPENITSQTEVCVYDDASYDICFKTVLKGCHLDANLTTQWSHIFSRDRNQTQSQATPTQHPSTNHTAPSPTYANETTVNQSQPANQTADEHTTPNPNYANEIAVNQSQPANQTADEHTTPNPNYANENAVNQSQLTNQTADEYTTPSPTYANENAVNQSQPANQTADEYTTPSPTYANETAVNQSQPGNQTADEYSTVLSCEEFAEVYCQAASLHHCILPEDVYNETGAMDWNATCACTYYEPPPPAPQPTVFFNGTNVTATEDPYLTCRSRDNLEPLQTSPSPNSSNSTSAPSMLDVCDEEETLLLGMASVVHTEIWSTREGSVCTFIGGNLHSPFQPGVFYISEHLPANLSMGGSTIRVTVTMVILDLPDLSRGDVLLLNATSAFSYLSYPVPPSDIFRENCTCQKLLEDHLDAETPKECSCETWHLHNMTEDVCNCTSYFHNEDAGFEKRYSCNCINFCFGVLRYFLNPPHVATLEEFEVDSCDCVALNATLLAQGLTSPLQHHVDSCLVLYQRNYTCTNLTYTMTHHTVPVSVNCACENTTVEGVKRTPCSCDPDGLTTKIQQSFKNKVTLLQCLNWTITSDKEMFQHTFNRSDCSYGTDLAADAGNQTSTVAPVQTTSSSTHNDSSTNATTQPGFDCSCEITCSIHVEQDCIGSDDEQCSNIEHTHTLPLDDSMCKCHKIYNDPWNISDIMEWYQPKNYTQEVKSFPQFENASLSNSSWFNSTFLNGSNSNKTVNLTDINTSNFTYELECDCIDIDKVVYHVSPSYCVEHHAYEVFDCDCLVPPDNETQFILDHWDHNATIIDQMITRASHEVIIIEPSLQITFTRRPEPSIVDSIDQVIFDFQISHTEESDAPAFNVTLQLDAVNFTRNTGAAKLVPSCAHSDLCDVTYDNFIGRFHLPLLPVDPPGAVFEGMFNLSVGNHLDFVANSLITATSIAWYDSSIVDFPGRLYPSIAASDTVQIDAPTISTSLDFTTANTRYFFTTELGDPPKTFSIGDYVRMKATLWIPEITLQFLNFSIEAVMQNFTAGSAQCLLSQRIYNRNDTPSVYPEVDITGKLFPGSQYNNCRFLDTGISVTPGVIVNEADNIADEQDFIHLLLTFRVEDEPYWVQGVEVPFTMSATYVSDYTRTPVLLVDDSIVMTVVEPQLSLRVELLDHPWQIEQVVNQEAEYTCNENTCCDSEDCNAGTTCITATDSIDDCATAECRCYSGYTSNELEGCTAVGRTAGDILNYGLTVTHHVDYTGRCQGTKT
ncbi:uncharacterized protein LOC117299582 [Asterias rubens]|uniref:uncharacterized protein LOC117299582 n=1 Tax=Asterias rubens TaxID=7604 RepID=UPI001455300D|nr:uncharacterized protein LOC117299582 [Asterias rubens]